MKTILINGRIIDGDVTREGAKLVFENGKIVDANYRGETPADACVVDVEDGYILPGLIDIHLHGGDGFDYMDGTAEAFARVSDIHMKHGATALAPTTVAAPHKELLAMIDQYQIAKKRADGPDLIGIHLEGPYISQAMRGAQPESYVRAPIMREVDELLEHAAGGLGRISAAPELPGSREMAEKLRKAGVLLAVGHSEATAAQVIESAKWGFSHLTHMYCATPSTRKINQRVYAGQIEAAYLLDDMTVELIGDGRHVPKEVMQMVMKFKGVERTALITDAVRPAGTNVTESVLGSAESGHRVIIEDGVAKLPDRTFYAGSIATADRVLRNAVLEYQLPLTKVVRMMTETPARLMGYGDRKGRLGKGMDADIAVFDGKLNVQRVYVRGELRHDAREVRA